MQGAAGNERASRAGSWRLQPVRRLGCQRPHRQAGAELLPGQPRESASTGRAIQNGLLCLGHQLGDHQLGDQRLALLKPQHKMSGAEQGGRGHKRSSRQKTWACLTCWKQAPVTTQPKQGPWLGAWGSGARSPNHPGSPGRTLTPERYLPLHGGASPAHRQSWDGSGEEKSDGGRVE